MNWTVDAHCHWSDERVFATAGSEIPRLVAGGILAFQLGGVEPAEWQRQTLLAKQFPGRIWRAFGLHPYFVAAQPLPVLESAWQELQNHAPGLEALGEMGLDFRKTYQAREQQLDFLTRQLRLAAGSRKPAILHIVRAHEEALRELKALPVTGMVHAFTGGPQLAARYLALGLHLSVGAKLLFPEGVELAESVRRMPLERLLLESDGPDQPPPGRAVHDSLTVFAVAERVSVLKKLPLERVLEQTRANLFRLIDKEIQP